MRYSLKRVTVYSIIILFLACISWADRIPAPPPLPTEPREEQDYFTEIYNNLHRLQVVTTNPDGSMDGKKGDMVLFTSCIVLIITGLPIKFHDSGWAAFMFDVMGGIQVSSLLHRIGAGGLIGVGTYHLLYLIASAEGRWNFINLLPSPKDLKDLVRMLKYFLGRVSEPPKFGRFSYVEKFDYWAVYWGMVIMIGSGCLLWFENFALRVLPKYVLDIAKEAHSDEALLATLAIIIWHFYNVHFNPRKFPMNRVWITGRISEGEMVEEHPLEYEQIVRGENVRGGAAP